MEQLDKVQLDNDSIFAKDDKEICERYNKVIELRNCYTTIPLEMRLSEIDNQIKLLEVDKNYVKTYAETLNTVYYYLEEIYKRFTEVEKINMRKGILTIFTREQLDNEVTPFLDDLDDAKRCSKEVNQFIDKLKFKRLDVIEELDILANDYKEIAKVKLLKMH